MNDDDPLLSYNECGISLFLSDGIAFAENLDADPEHRYTDGSRETVGTDESWRWCNDGPILYADLMDGEVYDARKVPSFSQNAALSSYPVCPTASPADGILEQEVFTPELLLSPSGAQILDFKQNLAGYVRFRVQGEAGQQIRLRLGEALDHGEFSNLTLQMDLPELPVKRQEIVYTRAGGEEVFRPDFFYAGFRYALVEGLDTVDPAEFEAVAVYSALRFTGSFSCSNQKLTQFARNTLWSLKGNFVDLPTDCPQREKSGWTGDAQIFAKTACYFAVPAAFYRKWLRDVRDCQEPGGSLRWAEASYDSPYGHVFSRWERTAEETAFQIEIPSNTEAELTLPDGTQRILSCGSYSYLLRPIPDQKQ